MSILRKNSILIFLALMCSGWINPQAWSQKKLSYPTTKKEVKTRQYHGSLVTEQFAWLDKVDSESVKSWAKAQDDFTLNFTSTYPNYEALKARLTSLMQVKGRLVVPSQTADKFFYHKADDSGKWSLFQRDAAGGKPQALELPFNSRAAYFYLPSPDGSHVALGMARQGGYFDWKVLNVKSGKLLDETLTGTALGNTRLVWTNDGSGFYYLSSGKVAENGRRTELRVKYHKAGNPYDKDEVVYTPESDGAKLHLDLTRNGNRLVITEREGAAIAARVKFVETHGPDRQPKDLVAKAEASYIFLGDEGSTWYFQTDLAAPNGKVVSVNVNQATKLWKEVIAEPEQPMMGYQSAGGTMLPLMAGGHLIIPSQKDLKISLNVYDLAGQFKRSAALPSGGLYFNANGLNALSGHRESPQVLTEFIGITEPNTVFSVDVNSGNVSVFDRATVSFDADQYTSEVVFASSKDGTRIPISLTYKKGLKRDRKNYVMVQVYGAIAFTNYPYFQGDYMGWLDMGGIHAVAHIRGGGAYGAQWHQDGIARKKQNGIDDYIAALEWLIEAQYTQADRIVINGVSAGTIPVGAVMTQRPDLVGAVVSHYGMLDMIGYSEKFASDQNYGYMIPEIGKADNAEDFKAIAAYSPYQKLARKRKYPPVLALTSDADAPLNADSYKFIAWMQQFGSNKQPSLLQMAWGSGHSGFGSQQHSPIQTFTDELAFLIKAMNIDIGNWLE